MHSGIDATTIGAGGHIPQLAKAMAPPLHPAPLTSSYPENCQVSQILMDQIPQFTRKFKKILERPGALVAPGLPQICHRAP